MKMQNLRPDCLSERNLHFDPEFFSLVICHSSSMPFLSFAKYCSINRSLSLIVVDLIVVVIMTMESFSIVSIETVNKTSKQRK